MEAGRTYMYATMPVKFIYTINKPSNDLKLLLSMYSLAPEKPW